MIPPKIMESDQLTLSWIDQGLRAGLSRLKQEDTYNSVGECISYLNGTGGPLRTNSQLSRVRTNRLRKINYEITSSLTDVRSIWTYETANNELKPQADIFNLLVRNWWRTSFSDRKLQDALMFSAVGGSGYLKVEWDPKQPGGGNISLVPLDPRDVIPINPAAGIHVQQWEGVAIRVTKSLAALRDRYPTKWHKLALSSKNWFDPKNNGSKSKGLEIVSPVLDRLFSGRMPSTGPSDIDLVHIFVKDESMNTGKDPVLMGRPDTNWCYLVYPLGSIHPITKKVVTEEMAKLYPRGRLIICTPDVILEDLPNPYWHGLFPIVKFTLDPMPWSILGSSLIADLIPLQDSLNNTLQGIENGVKQWLQKAMVADSRAISKSLVKSFDSRLPGQKLMINPTLGEGVKLLDGPQLPAFIMEYVQTLVESMDDNSGVKGLRELAQLKQMPSSDTIEKFMDAQSPLLRLRARMMEQSLAEMAEMVKSMILQYYDAPRRLQILGPDGITPQDFDYDPRTMIPSLSPSDAGYKPEYDSRLSRIDRGMHHQKNFAFTVSPGSFLSVSNTQQKMYLLQLARMPGAPLIDPWTLLENFDVPNLGPIPKGSVFDKIQQAQKLGIYPPSPTMMAQAAGGGGGEPGGPPAGGPPSGKPPGRPPSGQSPPELVTRKNPDGSERQTISESGR
jgi:hypothetical protein